MRIGFAGVANSHAFSDARSAEETGGHDLVLWDPDDPARARQFGDRFHAVETASGLDDLLESAPDLVIVTLRPRRIAAAVAAILDSGAACFVNKMAAVSHEQIEALERAVAGREDRFMTASVLRFAAALPHPLVLSPEPGRDSTPEVNIVVRHDIADFLRPERAWQDDPTMGGGTAISLGFHAWELLDAVLGDAPATLHATADQGRRGSQSEERVLFNGTTTSGRTLTVKLDGRVGPESYRISAEGNGLRVEHVLTADDPHADLGYRECFGAALRLAEGAPPAVRWSDSAAVLRSTVRAAEAARTADQAERAMP